MGGLIQHGTVALAIAQEHPELGVRWLDVAAAPSRTPPDISARLAHLSDRWWGAQAVALRHQPVPHAHRVFFRHLGLDPDIQRPPQEAIVLRRLLDGGFLARGLPADALTIACMETGVGVWAIDAAATDGALALAVDPTSRIVVIDDAGPLARLFGEPADRVAITKATRRMRLFAIQVPGVPEIFTDAALERGAELLVEE